MSGRDVYLHPEVQELALQCLGMLQNVGDLEPPGLKKNLQSPDQVALGDTPVVPAVLALCIAAGYGDSIEGEAALPQHVHDGRTYPRSVYGQGRLAVQLGSVYKPPHPLGDVWVEHVPETLQVADVELVLPSVLTSDLLSRANHRLGYLRTRTLVGLGGRLTHQHARAVASTRSSWSVSLHCSYES